MAHGRAAYYSGRARQRVRPGDFEMPVTGNHFRSSRPVEPSLPPPKSKSPSLAVTLVGSYTAREHRVNSTLANATGKRTDRRRLIENNNNNYISFVSGAETINTVRTFRTKRTVTANVRRPTYCGNNFTTRACVPEEG